MDMLDKRIHAYRIDLADVRLKGRVDALSFVEGIGKRVTASLTPLLRAPDPMAMQTTQLLHGETLKVFEEKDGWAWVQADADGYVGYAPVSALGKVLPQEVPTHMVSAVITHLYPEPDIKTRPLTALYAGSPIHLDEGEEKGAFARCEGGWVTKAHIQPARGIRRPDIIEIAKRFMGAPYLWGGRTYAGIDCSGLVQTTLRLAGLSCPRDSDQQAISLGHDVDQPARGDLIFFPGHVGFMVDGEMLLHANATHMAVTIDPLSEVIKRISRDQSKPVTAMKRLDFAEV